MRQERTESPFAWLFPNQVDDKATLPWSRPWTAPCEHSSKRVASVVLPGETRYNYVKLGLQLGVQVASFNPKRALAIGFLEGDI